MRRGIPTYLRLHRGGAGDFFRELAFSVHEGTLPLLQLRADGGEVGFDARQGGQQVLAFLELVKLPCEQRVMSVRCVTSVGHAPRVRSTCRASAAARRCCSSIMDRRSSLVRRSACESCLICAANVSFSIDRLWICPSWENQKGGRR